MHLLPNWRAVLRYAWSVRLMLLAALKFSTEQTYQFFRSAAAL
ncbi:hypothetical protein [Phyllobacterium brassicacearum]|nr:hypothetical protein [Phyllobacterium brassicacearum]TDQ24180.1 hypothetical protein DEV91_11558 [Phyllobacterium brassicacearum]